jgi:hypothetical protein
VLQNLEAAVAQVVEAPNSSGGVLVSRIAAAEAAGVSNPLVRSARVHVRILALSEAHAGVQSALKHLHGKVAITVQLSSLRSALGRAEEALLDTQTQKYLCIAHCCDDLPSLQMFSATESLMQCVEGSSACSAEPEPKSEDDPDGEDAENVQLLTTSNITPKQGADLLGMPPCQSSSSLGSDSICNRAVGSTSAGRQPVPSSASSAAGGGTLLSKEAALRLACASGYIQLNHIGEDTAKQLVDGVDTALLKALCQCADTLVVTVGQALAGVQSLEVHLRQIEAEKAESVRPCQWSAEIACRMPCACASSCKWLSLTLAGVLSWRMDPEHLYSFLICKVQQVIVTAKQVNHTRAPAVCSLHS